LDLLVRRVGVYAGDPPTAVDRAYLFVCVQMRGVLVRHTADVELRHQGQQAAPFLHAVLPETDAGNTLQEDDLIAVGVRDGPIQARYRHTTRRQVAIVDRLRPS